MYNVFTAISILLTYHESAEYACNYVVQQKSKICSGPKMLAKLQNGGSIWNAGIFTILRFVDCVAYDDF